MKGDEKLHQSLNPAYKRGVVNGTPEVPRKLILPEAPPQSYPALYAVLNASSNAPQVLHAVDAGNANTSATTHRVRKGETLGKIANRYRVSVQDLRVWNNLSKNTIVPGQRLRILSPDGNAGSGAPSTAASNAYITYRVNKGDTLSGIAQRYRMASVSTIRSDNGLNNSRIKPGMTLKIKVK